MKNILAIAITAFLINAPFYAAYALTIPTGHVLTSDGTVVAVEHSETTQKQLDQGKVVVAAGKVILKVADATVAVDIKDLQGKSKSEQVDVIKDHATQEIARQAIEAQLESEGISVSDNLDEALAAAEAGIDQAINEVDFTPAQIAQIEKTINENLNEENIQNVLKSNPKLTRQQAIEELQANNAWH